ncbi:MAG: helix-turn-helix domain-containing protein [Bacteroidota bacterium]
MLKSIKLKANPNKQQKAILSQWMGCARHIWNAKTKEEKEQRLHLSNENKKEYPTINQTYSHLKDKKETPWLFDCPSIILRNSIANWYTTYQNFFKKRCGRPQHKKKMEEEAYTSLENSFLSRKGKMESQGSSLGVKEKILASCA